PDQMNCVRTIIVLLAVAGACVAGEESKPSTHTHRLFGLCCVEREPDLRALVATFPGVKMGKVDFEKGDADFEYDAAVLGAEKAKGMNKQAIAAAGMPKLAGE